jgi:TIR domain
MADIFISYKREDAERVRQLAVALETEGFSVWWDPALPIGQTYSSSIHSQLATAKAVMPVWTARSIDSEWVQEEAVQGKRRGVLLPVRMDAVEPPLGFTMVQTADLSDWSGGEREHPEWRRLIDQAHALVGGSRATATMPGLPPGKKMRLMHVRPRHLTAAVAVIGVLVTGGLAIQRNCDNTSRYGRSGSSEGKGDSAATRVPRDVPAPSVSAGQHSSFVEARPLSLSVAEPGEIFTVEDTRFYKIENHLKLRDRTVIRLQNASATLRPDMKIYNANRSEVAEAYDPTPGASVEHTLTLTPGQPIYVQVLPYDSIGKYKLSVTPQQAFDNYEPNDDSLTASAVTIATDIVANVMDTTDHDWYRVTGAAKPRITVMFENLSSTLRPDVKVFDANKSEIAEKYDATPGANLTFDINIKQSREFYIQVLPYDSAGQYRLRIE